MKILTLASLFFVLPSLVYSQPGYAGNPDDWAYRTRDLMNDLINRTTKDYQPMDLTDIEGTPYFVEDFNTGMIRLENRGVETESKLRYNAYRDEFEVNDGNSIMYILKVPNISITVNGNKYVIHKYETADKKVVTGYLKTLYEANSFIVFKREKKELKEGKQAENPILQSWPSKLVGIEEYYFLDKSKDMASVISKKNPPLLENISEEERSALSKFAKKNKINFKDEQDIVEFYRYYNDEILPKS